MNTGRRKRSHSQSGQALVEFAVLYAAVVLPLTFMTIFVAEMLWIWHSVADFTRDGARYAVTHYCQATDGSNVVNYMQSHVPPMIDRAEFAPGGTAIIQVQFQDSTGQPFSQGDCADCAPDSVSISIQNYQFLRFAAFMRLPPVTIPPFTTNLPMESTGLDTTGTCVTQ